MRAAGAVGRLDATRSGLSGQGPGSYWRAGEVPCRFSLATAEAEFPAGLRPCSAGSEADPDVGAAVAAIGRGRDRRRCRADRAFRTVRPVAPDARRRWRFTPARDRRGDRRASIRSDRVRSSARPSGSEAYHERQLLQDARWTDATGAELGWRWTPVAAAGLCNAGRRLASHPSSVLMNAIPGLVAGVRSWLVICADARGRSPSRWVPLAARLAGVETVYRIGGPRRSPLAFGTETIAAVDKDHRPRQRLCRRRQGRVFGRVGIDMIAGPSEV